MFGGLQIIAQFPCVPEISYTRDRRHNIDENVDDNWEDLVALEHHEKINHEKAATSALHTEATNSQDFSIQAPEYREKTFVEELAVFTGSYSNENFLQLLIAPCAVVLSLVVSWIILFNSLHVVLYVMIAFVLAQLFGAPPYLINPTSNGYLSFSPFIGGALGTIILGAMSDPLIKWCARRNNGIYEPEYRLVACFLGVVTGAGLMRFGKSVVEGASPYATATMHGLMLFGVMFVCIGTSNYALDAYRGMTNEIFIASMAVKNLNIYGFSYFANSWTATAGPEHVCYVWGGVALALIATLPIAFVSGRKYRSYWVRHDLLANMHIRTHAE